jgi:hypothetical protein
MAWTPSSSEPWQPRARAVGATRATATANAVGRDASRCKGLDAVL